MRSTAVATRWWAVEIATYWSSAMAFSSAQLARSAVMRTRSGPRVPVKLLSELGTVQAAQEVVLEGLLDGLAAA